MKRREGQKKRRKIVIHLKLPEIMSSGTVIISRSAERERESAVHVHDPS